MGLDNPLHIAFLVVILLLVFGAKRLPEIGRSLGSGMREFKDSITGHAASEPPALKAPAEQPQPPAELLVDRPEQDARQVGERQRVERQRRQVGSDSHRARVELEEVRMLLHRVPGRMRQIQPQRPGAVRVLVHIEPEVPAGDRRVGAVIAAELDKLVNQGDYACAFSMFPTSIEDLMTIADAGGIMPPKSTWFEPKLRDAMFCHMI